MGNTRQRARTELPATARRWGCLSALALGGFWLVRRVDRRRPVETPPPARCCRDIVEESMNLLGAVRGYCELAMLKGENGSALARRMEASIDTVDEISALLRQLDTACRRRSR